MTERFAQIVRLMWIDSVIDNEGEIGRADITQAFGISTPQASHDLRSYQAMNPRRLYYDRSGKTYRQIEGSRPLFTVAARSAAVEIVAEVEKARGSDRNEAAP